MKTYLVEWSMEFDAESPEDAARQALAVHRDPSSIATVFKVTEIDEERKAVDLLALAPHDDCLASVKDDDLDDYA